MISSNKIKIILLLISFIIPCENRSPYRPIELDDPHIKVFWQDQPNEFYTFRDSHLQEGMFKLYDEKYFYAHLLPHGPINFRYEPDKSVSSEVIQELFEEIVQEIKHLKKRQRKVVFKNFKILKKRDINRRFHTGLYVVEFKDYPFVLKLFVETPQSIVQPLHKGFEPICFYYLAGLNRHFNGFARIKNLENIQNVLTNDPEWSDKVRYPREWFILPKDNQLITIQGWNIGKQKTCTSSFPAIYGIFCDKIIWKKAFSLSDCNDRQMAISLSNRLGQRIDSHINNYGIEINYGNDENEPEYIVPIDFEHFITAVDIPENHICENYFIWYRDLTFRMIKRLLFRNKHERRIAQYRSYCEPC